MNSNVLAWDLCRLCGGSSKSPKRKVRNQFDHLCAVLLFLGRPAQETMRDRRDRSDANARSPIPRPQGLIPADEARKGEPRGENRGRPVCPSCDVEHRTHPFAENIGERMVLSGSMDNSSEWVRLWLHVTRGSPYGAPRGSPPFFRRAAHRTHARWPGHRAKVAGVTTRTFAAPRPRLQ